MTKVYKVSPETASRALYYLDQHNGHLGPAAHDLDLSRTAIAPYYDTISDRAAGLFARMRYLNDESRTKWIAVLRDIAAKMSVTT